MKRYIILLALPLALWNSCKPEEDADPDLGATVTPTFNINKIDDHKFVFINTTKGALIKWDFGNGQTSQNQSDTVYYAFAGTYNATLTAINKAGKTTASKQIVISDSDPAVCQDSLFNLLSGGCAAIDSGKTWVIDHGPGAMGVGDPAKTEPNWWTSAQDHFSTDGCIYDNSFTFKLKGLEFTMTFPGGYTLYNWYWANNEKGMTMGKYDDVCVAAPTKTTNWSIVKSGGKIKLNITNGGHLGYYDGTGAYEILKLNEDTLYVRNTYSYDGDGWRYLRFLKKKYFN